MSKALEVLKKCQKNIASCKEKCDEDELIFWNKIDEAITELEAMEARIKELETPKTCDGCKYFKIDDEFNDGYGQCFYGIHAPNYETSYHKGDSFCCSTHELKDE